MIWWCRDGTLLMCILIEDFSQLRIFNYELRAHWIEYMNDEYMNT